jgi:hypothetical protein
MTKKRVPVPTGADRPESAAEHQATEATGAAATEAGAAAEDTGSPSSAEYTVAFSPRQVAVGFAVVAGLIAIVLSRRRRRGRPPVDD